MENKKSKNLKLVLRSQREQRQKDENVDGGRELKGIQVELIKQNNAESAHEGSSRHVAVASCKGWLSVLVRAQWAP